MSEGLLRDIKPRMQVIERSGAVLTVEHVRPRPDFDAVELYFTEGTVGYYQLNGVYLIEDIDPRLTCEFDIMGVR